MHLQIEKEPIVHTATFPAGYEQFLGQIYVQEESVKMNINVYRERWIEHLAFIGGLNMFWIFIFYAFFQCFVNWQFTASLRKEANPSIVHTADREMNHNPVNNIRRKFFSSTLLGMPTSEEQMLD